jgi:hypothetical protein
MLPTLPKNATKEQRSEFIHQMLNTGEGRRALVEIMSYGRELTDEERLEKLQTEAQRAEDQKRQSLERFAQQKEQARIDNVFWFSENLESLSEAIVREYSVEEVSSFVEMLNAKINVAKEEGYHSLDSHSRDRKTSLGSSPSGDTKGI